VTQANWLVMTYRVAIIADLVTILAFIAQYSRLAKWWRNPVGRTIVIKDILLVLILMPTAMSLFLNLNRLDSMVVGWVDAGLLGLLTPVMIWRIVVWQRMHRAEGRDQ
jgi:hypothetical protein